MKVGCGPDAMALRTCECAQRPFGCTVAAAALVAVQTGCAADVDDVPLICSQHGCQAGPAADRLGIEDYAEHSMSSTQSAAHKQAAGPAASVQELLLGHLLGQGHDSQHVGLEHGPHVSQVVALHRLCAQRQACIVDAQVHLRTRTNAVRCSFLHVQMHVPATLLACGPAAGSCYSC